MLCTKCNSEIKSGKKFCGICGTPAPAEERRCGSCNGKLEDDENFCPDCGVKYGEAPVAKAQTSGKSQIVGSDSVCHITTKGNMAAIGDTIFFKHNDKIYSASMSNSQKAKVLIDKRNFLNIEDEYEDYPIQNIFSLNAWNGKLYFYARQDCHDGQEAIFGKYGSEGIFSYCPKTNKLELIDKLERCQGAHVFANKAYACKQADREATEGWRTSIAEKYGLYSSEYEKIANVIPSIIVTIDLETKQRNEVFMPVLTFDAWPDLVVEEESKNTVVPSDWYIPFFKNGYLYSSSFGALNPIRFQANNPQKYEILASGLSPCFRDGELSQPFVAYDDMIMMLDYIKENLITFSNATSQTINNFKTGMVSKWQIYGGNYLACYHYQYNENSRKFSYVTTLFKVNEGKPLCYVDERYSRMDDAIYFNNTTYALGDLCLEDKEGEIVYDGLALYRIPWDKMFKADTNLDDFAQPLF